MDTVIDLGAQMSFSDPGNTQTNVPKVETAGGINLIMREIYSPTDADYFNTNGTLSTLWDPPVNLPILPLDDEHNHSDQTGYIHSRVHEHFKFVPDVLKATRLSFGYPSDSF